MCNLKKRKHANENEEETLFVIKINNNRKSNYGPD